MNEGETSTRLGLLGSPSEAEVIIIDRDLHLLRRTDARYHVAHISTRAGIEAVRQAKAEGLAVTADTSPPYFCSMNWQSAPITPRSSYRRHCEAKMTAKQ
jgi:dihydroorotase